MAITAERSLGQDDIVIVTGGRRGIGGALSELFLAEGATVVASFVDPSTQKEKRNDELSEKAKELPGRLVLVQSDITKRAGRQVLVKTALDLAPEGNKRIRAAIWNAAGGLERDKEDEEGWIDKINVDSQLALLDEMLPYIEGGSGILIPSHYSDGYGVLEQPPGYPEVARTKKLAQVLFGNRAGELWQNHGFRMGFLSAGLTKETSAYSGFNRRYRPYLKDLESSLPEGRVLMPFEVAEPVVDMVVRGFEPGETRYVGSRDLKKLDPNEPAPFIWGRYEVWKRLHMYGPHTMLVEAFESPADRAFGRGWHRVTNEDVEEHFTNEYSDAKAYRGFDQAEFGAQVLGLTLLAASPGTKRLGMMDEATLKWHEAVAPDDYLVAEAKITGEEENMVFGKVEMRVLGTLVTEMDARILLAPSARHARTSMFAQRMGRIRRYWD